MFKLVIHVQCDSCRDLFVFGRVSAYTTDALQFNTSAIAAWLREYRWCCEKTEKISYHYCPECCAQLAGQELAHSET